MYYQPNLNTYHANSNICRLKHGHFHIGLVIIPRPPYWPETESRVNMGRRMITRPIWKCPCIKLFITYFRHLEKRHPYWPETIYDIYDTIYIYSIILLVCSLIRTSKCLPIWFVFRMLKCFSSLSKIRIEWNIGLVRKQIGQTVRRRLFSCLTSLYNIGFVRVVCYRSCCR